MKYHHHFYLPPYTPALNATLLQVITGDLYI